MLIHHRAGPTSIRPGTEPDGGYLASASDLMIGLLFIFIILVVVLALEQRAALIRVGDPRGSVTSAIGEGIKAAMPGVQVNPETGVISLPEDVLFEVGKAEIRDPGQLKLAEAVKHLVDLLPCYVANQRKQLKCPNNPQGHEIETIFIEGHTDNRPMLRSGYDNMSLSLDRARAVERALVQGTPLAGYRNTADEPLFSFSAYADTRPLKGLDPSDDRNRRVDLRIVLTYRPLKELIPGFQPDNASARN